MNHENKKCNYQKSRRATQSKTHINIIVDIIWNTHDTNLQTFSVYTILHLLHQSHKYSLLYEPKMILVFHLLFLI